MEDSRDDHKLTSSIIIEENFDDTTESHNQAANHSRLRNKSQDISKLDSVSKMNTGILKRNSSNYATENARKPLFRVIVC